MEQIYVTESPIQGLNPGQWTPAEWVAFAENYLLPVLRYTADKKGYIQKQEQAYYTGQDKDDYDRWAQSRAKLAVEQWEAMGLGTNPQ